MPSQTSCGVVFHRWWTGCHRWMSVLALSVTIPAMAQEETSGDRRQTWTIGATQRLPEPIGNKDVSVSQSRRHGGRRTGVRATISPTATGLAVRF